MGTKVIKYKFMKFRKRKYKWGESYWEIIDHKYKMLRGKIKLYGVEPNTGWLFVPGMGMLFDSKDCQDIGQFIEYLNCCKETKDVRTTRTS